MPSLPSLADTCREAVEKLQNLVLNARTRPPVPLPEGQSSSSQKYVGTALAWGQFIDPPPGGRSGGGADPQLGIFGSSACVQVLCLHKPERHPDLLAEGLRALPMQVAPTTDADLSKWLKRYADKGDLGTTFKVASLLDCVLAARDARVPEAQDTAGPLVDLLLSLATREGWPDGESANPVEQHPNVHATAVALFSLAKAPLGDAGKRAIHGAVTWLKEQRLDECTASVLALLVIGLERLTARTDDEIAAEKANNTPQWQEMQSLLGDCRKSLSTWIRRAYADETKRAIEGVDYRPSIATDARPEPATANEDRYASRYEYLMYSPYCLAALAVAESATLRAQRRNRRFARSVTQVFAEKAATNGQFTFALRRRVASVETLWIVRLLTSFMKSGSLQRKSSIVRDAAVPIVWTLLGLMVGTTLWISGMWLMSQGRGLLSSVGGGVLAVLGTIVIALVARFIWDLIDRRRKYGASVRAKGSHG